MTRYAAIDAVGLARGGGAEVLRSILRECREQSVYARVATDDRAVRLLAESEGAEVTTVAVPRILWLLIGARVWVRKTRAVRVLHLVNVLPLGSGRWNSILFMHQSNVFHVDEARALSPRTRLRYLTLRAVILRSAKRSNSVIVQSPVVAELLQTAADRSLSIFVCRPSPPVLPSPQPGPAAGTDVLRVAYIGSDAPHKNLDTLFGALALYEGPSIHLEATLPDLPSRVPGTPLGWISRNDVATLLARADVLVMPSLRETVGLPMLEAAAMECCILAADLPYSRDLMGDGAVYFEPRSQLSLAAQLARLADPIERSRTVAEATRRLAELRSENGYQHLVTCIAYG